MVKKIQVFIWQNYFLYNFELVIDCSTDAGRFYDLRFFNGEVGNIK